MIKKRVTLSEVTPEMWNEEHNAQIDQFAGAELTSFPRLLVAHVDPINGLILSDTVPYGPVVELYYFIRRKPSRDAEGLVAVSSETFFEEIQYGMVTGRHIESLLRMMTGVYVPMFFRNSSWPDRLWLIFMSY